MGSIEKVRLAAKKIEKKIIRTPLVYSPTISRMFGAEIYLKLENLQNTGSFKIRGASNKLIQSLEGIGPGGVVAASAGNHAQGVALAAKLAGVPSTIVMPEGSSISKQEATASYGGKVVIFGQSIEDSLAKAEELAGNGLVLIHPFDDLDIINGQGTIALEIFEDLKDIEMIVAPIGGGGLMSGIASVAKAIRPEVTIIGVESSACPSAFESLQQGQLTTVNAEPSIADGIAVKQVGTRNFELIQKYVDDVVLVEEGDIAQAILLLLERKKTMAEGAGAVSLAAI
ncbi:MAG: pyridoxal-phosphate dependent enzyme, partial [Proteobacteria bacterium]|nr:pyridoxal-phosphate dependent enzyme [Pseudomonadota bacterium]